MSLTLKDIAVKLMRGELPPMAAEELGGERLKVCESCEYMTRYSRQCKLCSCFLDLKVKLLESSCPINHW